MEEELPPCVHPVALRPQPVLSHIDIPPAWCQFPSAYHELRPMDTRQYDIQPSAADTITFHDIGQPKYSAYPAVPTTVSPDDPTKSISNVYTPVSSVDEEKHYAVPKDALLSVSVKEEEDEINEFLERKEQSHTPKSDSGVTPAKRGRPTENPCWSYFIRLDDQNVRCRLCSKIVKSACATNMTKHLERHHQADYQQLIVQIRQYRQQKGPPAPSLTTPQPTPPAVAAQQQPQPVQHSLVIQTAPPASHCLLPTTNHFVKTEAYSTTDYTPQLDREQQLLFGGAFEQRSSDPWQQLHSVYQPSLQWQSFDAWGGAAGIPHSLGVGEAGLDQLSVNGWLSHQQAHSASTSTAEPLAAAMQAPPPQAPPPQVPPTQRQPHEKPFMKRNRKTEHPVWEFFKRTGDGNAQCSICAGVVKSPCSSNFMRHLMRHHSVEYNSVYVKWVQKRGPLTKDAPPPHAPPPQQQQQQQMLQQQSVLNIPTSHTPLLYQKDGLTGGVIYTTTHNVIV